MNKKEKEKIHKYKNHILLLLINEPVNPFIFIFVVVYRYPLIERRLTIVCLVFSKTWKTGTRVCVCGVKS